MTTDVKTDEGAVERLQEAAPAQLSMAWLDEHRDDMVLALEEHGRTLVCSRLGFSVNTVRTWERRRGLLGQSGAAEEEAPDSPVGGRATNEITRLFHLDSIEANPWQPRKTMDAVDLLALADSIAATGLLQPPLGRPTEFGVQIAFGHRRVEAIRILVEQGKWDGGVPILLRDLSDSQMAVIAMEENAKRTDVNPLELLRGYQKVIDDGLMNVTELADSIGLARSTVSNNLRILNLPDDVLELVGTGDMGTHAAREFLAVCGQDHGHGELIIAMVKEGIRESEYMKDTWSVKGVRARLGRHIRFHSSLLPVDPRERMEAGRTPVFDVEAFAKEFPAQVHNIPAPSWGNDGESMKWTCNVGEWKKRQSVAVKVRAEERVSEGTAPAAAPEPPVDKKAVEKELREQIETEEKRDQEAVRDVVFADERRLLVKAAFALLKEQQYHRQERKYGQGVTVSFTRGTTKAIGAVLGFEVKTGENDYVALRFDEHDGDVLDEKLLELLEPEDLRALLGQLIAHSTRRPIERDDDEDEGGE